MSRHNHHNGLKTTLLFGTIFGVLILAAAVISRGSSVWIIGATLLGLA